MQSQLPKAEKPVTVALNPLIYAINDTAEGGTRSPTRITLESCPPISIMRRVF